MYETPTSQDARPLVERPPTPNADPASMGLKAVLGRAVRSRLFLLTTLGAIDGQVMALAAGGMLSQPVVVLTVGLTLIAGVGAFMTALTEARLRDAVGRRVFAATAVLSIAVNVAAAAAGLALAQVVSFENVRYFAALALAAVAYEIGAQTRLRFPGGVPAPAAFVGIGLAVELLW